MQQCQTTKEMRVGIPSRISFRFYDLGLQPRRGFGKNVMMSIYKMDYSATRMSANTSVGMVNCTMPEDIGATSPSSKLMTTSF